MLSKKAEEYRERAAKRARAQKAKEAAERAAREAAEATAASEALESRRLVKARNEEKRRINDGSSGYGTKTKKLTTVTATTTTTRPMSPTKKATTKAQPSPGEKGQEKDENGGDDTDKCPAKALPAPPAWLMRSRQNSKTLVGDVDGDNSDNDQGQGQDRATPNTKAKDGTGSAEAGKAEADADAEAAADEEEEDAPHAPPRSPTRGGSGPLSFVPDGLALWRRGKRRQAPPDAEQPPHGTAI